MGENKSLYRLIVWKKPSCCLPQLLVLGGNSSEAPCVLPPGRWDPRVKGRSGHRAAGDWSSPDLNRFNKAKKNKKVSSRKKTQKEHKLKETESCTISDEERWVVAYLAFSIAPFGFL